MLEGAISILATAAFGLFFLWWALFPESVIRFYCRFHEGQPYAVRLYSSRIPLQIRIAGLLMLVLMLVLFLAGFVIAPVRQFRRG